MVEAEQSGSRPNSGIAAEFVVLRALLIGLYVRARRHVDGQGRTLTETYMVGYSATTALWLFSIFVLSPFRYALWTAAMAIDLAIPTRAWPVLEAFTIRAGAATVVDLARKEPHDSIAGRTTPHRPSTEALALTGK